MSDADFWRDDGLRGTPQSRKRLHAFLPGIVE
jgi:hypothetical protein